MVPVLMELFKEKNIKEIMTILLFLTLTHRHQNPHWEPRIVIVIFDHLTINCKLQSEIIDCVNWKKRMPSKSQ